LAASGPEWVIAGQKISKSLEQERGLFGQVPPRQASHIPTIYKSQKSRPTIPPSSRWKIKTKNHKDTKKKIKNKKT
jgi:hypothetical protein